MMQTASRLDLNREATDAGEESGRKARPVCVVVQAPHVPGAVFLFAITSKAPVAERLFLPISQIECRRAGLDFPC